MNKSVAGLLLVAAATLLPACAAGPSLPEACSVLPESGRCRAAITRWWFDERAGTCKAFIWGGCGGSVPFETLESCHAQCMPGRPLPPDALARPVQVVPPADGAAPAPAKAP
ncbi:MAG: BPTI/Kunitz domain-containing protein [Pseudomonadota bacterium]